MKIGSESCLRARLLGNCTVEIEILGETIPAKLDSKPLFDPDNSYLRG